MPKKRLDLFLIGEWIRTGKINIAQREVRRLSREKLSSDDVGELALTAWRVQLPETGISLLRKGVYLSDRIKDDAVPKHLLAYAACLIQIGAIEEGLSVLDHVSAKDFPLTYLVRASALISNWGYRSAAPLLREYLNHPDHDPYQGIVAEVNLASCYVFQEDLALATTQLARLVPLLEKNGSYRLLARAFELQAIIAFIQNDWRLVDERLEIANKILSPHHAPERVFIEKWATFAQLYRKNADAVSQRLLSALRQKAIDRCDFETIRECDHQLAFVKKDSTLFCHVYFGTPFQDYRDKIRLEYPSVGDASYDWVPSGGRCGGSAIILGRGRILDSSKGESIVTGATTLNLLRSLAKDFYRPRRAAEIYADIFPNEFFNPISSPVRLRQVIKRARAFFSTVKLPMRIHFSPMGYQLYAKGPVTIQIEASQLSLPRDPIEQIRIRAKGNPFSAIEVARWLEKPGRTVRRMIEAAVIERRLRRVGTGRATRYEFEATAS